jgi:Swt1-like HEPN
MATNPKLRTALLAKLAITPQALSLRVQKKKNLTPMSTELATYLIAHQNGIKIDKFLAPGEVEQVRELLKHTPAPVPREVARSAKSNRQAPRTKEIRFPTGFKVSDMLLPESKLKEAIDMARVYPLLYVLENSMREVIKRVMKAKYGDGWWDTKLTTGQLKAVHQKALDRKKNEKKWHQRRGAHAIDYVDLADLGTIIQSRAADFFPHILDDVDWFRSFMKELEPSRNVIGHMNPLDANNIKDLEVRIERWSKLLKHAGTALADTVTLKLPASLTVAVTP